MSVVDPFVSAVDRTVRFPVNALEYTNILLTTDDAVVGATPKEVVWTHRETTLYRYRSPDRRYKVPVLLVFALINRPEIFDLRPGSSLVEFLLEEGFDVFLVDWGYPDEEDADMGLDEFVCDELDWAVRETLRAAGAKELTLMGWCIGATLCAMYCGLDRGLIGTRPPRAPVRNLVELTMPIDGRASNYAKWVGDDDFDVDEVAELWGSVPGGAIDFANKMLKPVTNFWTTYRRLWDNVQEGTARRDAYQTMAKWVGDNPPFPGRAWAAVDSPHVPRRRPVAGWSAATRPAGGPAQDRPERARDHRRRGPHRATAGDDAVLRPDREPGRRAPGASGRAHRARRRIGSPQGTVARNHAVAGRTFQRLTLHVAEEARDK